MKTAKNQSEEATLAKTLKYYDIQNRGEITKDEFLRAMDKVGLQVFSREVRFSLIIQTGTN